MFTGLIETKGQVTAIAPAGDGIKLTIKCPEALADVKHGDSIAVSGVCLTVVEFNSEQFSAIVMQQSLDMSTLGLLAVGDTVNIERAAQLGSRLGGHIVQGHVDGIAKVAAVLPGDKWRVLRFLLPDELAPMLVDKGSVTVDGVSLTVSKISPVPTDSQHIDAKAHWFEVSLIPETLSATTLGERKIGDSVNIETDIVARHVARLVAFKHNAAQ